MTVLRDALLEREEEFFDHLRLAQALDRRLFESEPIAIGETTVTARHLMTIKSGLIIHLYNIVEAVMTLTIKEVSTAVLSTPPLDWSNNTLKEWLRQYASIGMDGNEDTRLDIVHRAALKLLKKQPIAELSFKKPSGTWSDKVINRFSKRLDVGFKLTKEVAREIMPSAKYGDKSPLEFLANRRNAIAHGRRSFERGADDLALDDIMILAGITLRYMRLVLDAFQSFVDNKKFMTEMV